MTMLVLSLAAWFGFVAADRWLSLPRSALADVDEPVVILCTVSAVALLTVQVALG